MNGKISFKALIVRQTDRGDFYRRIEERTIDGLPENAVLIRVHYSSLNYKDALSATGHKGVTRQYPHTPGIDAAGVVEQSSHEKFQPGQKVIVTGYDLGMNTPGGWGQFIRVPAEWVVACPEELTLREAMIYGTAGFTAAMAVMAIMEHGITPERGRVVVTGATGGLGSLAIAILLKLGYQVVAATGKKGVELYLSDLGAAEIISRHEVNDTSGKPLLPRRWIAAIDTVGGTILSTVIRSTDYFGCVACCGNAASYQLETTVYPFILRGVSLLGVDSAHCPAELREGIWRKLAGSWKPELPEGMTGECYIEDLEPEIQQILQGGRKGRLIINLNR